MSLIHRVREFAAHHRLWRPDTRVVAAVSGGSDSVAMLVLLHDLHALGHVRLDAVAHLNHGIRAEAGADEAFCDALAARLDVPFVAQRVDVPAVSRRTRRSIEVTARTERRAFLAELRRTRGADLVATAHTEDDQAETVLLRMARGTGSHGLGGIAPRSGRWIRPVLCATRVELQAELRARSEGWREDLTNRDLVNPRNRIRHELLPYLGQHFNPAVRKALVRLAEVARADEAWLSKLSVAASVSVLHVAETGVRLDRHELLQLPAPIAQRVARHALTLAGHTQPTLDDVRAVGDVAAGRRGAADVRKVRVEPFGDFVVLVARAVRRNTRPFRFVLAVPGVLQVTAANWVLEAGPAPPSSRPEASDRAVAQIDAATVGESLIVRSREPGDRIRISGSGGRKKVQDLFVDAKVERAERDRIPIVTHTDGRIVWVAGHVVGEEFRVTEGTKAVITLTLRRV